MFTLIFPSKKNYFKKNNKFGDSFKTDTQGGVLTSITRERKLRSKIR
jgi:hypothetical protein